MSRLDYFYKGGGSIYFRIRRDTEYWSAVRQLIAAFGKGLKHEQSSREFSVPLNSRSQVQLSVIFPEDWAVVVETDADEIDFTARPAAAAI